MPRPREFDEDEVVAQAMDVFWSRGYEATSVTDLMKATGLAKGSIYKGFGDKRAFFLRTLDTYLDGGMAQVQRILDGASSPLEGVRNILLMIVDQATCKGERRGCYAVNCAIELAPHDPSVQARVRAHQRRLRQLLEATIARGIEQGTLGSELDPKVAAHLLMTLINGLQVSGKLGMTRNEALSSVDEALRGLT